MNHWFAGHFSMAQRFIVFRRLGFWILFSVTFSGGKALTFYYGEMDAVSIGKELQTEVSEIRYGRLSCESVIVKGFLLGSLSALSFAFTADDIIDTFSSHIIHVCSLQLLYFIFLSVFFF